MLQCRSTTITGNMHSMAVMLDHSLCLKPGHAHCAQPIKDCGHWMSLLMLATFYHTESKCSVREGESIQSDSVHDS